MKNMAKGLCTFLSKTFWLSLLLGTVSINSHAEELYPCNWAGDSLLLFKGTTYRYTVDTPENQGLVSTLPTVTELKKQISRFRCRHFSLIDSQWTRKDRRRTRRGGLFTCCIVSQTYADRISVRERYPLC